MRFWLESLSWNEQRKGTLEFDTARLGFKYDDGRFLAAGRERYYHYTARETGASKGADMLFNEYLCEVGIARLYLRLDCRRRIKLPTWTGSG